MGRGVTWLNLNFDGVNLSKYLSKCYGLVMCVCVVGGYMVE